MFGTPFEAAGELLAHLHRASRPATNGDQAEDLPRPALEWAALVCFALEFSSAAQGSLLLLPPTLLLL